MDALSSAVHVERTMSPPPTKLQITYAAGTPIFMALKISCIPGIDDVKDLDLSCYSENDSVNDFEFGDANQV